MMNRSFASWYIIYIHLRNFCYEHLLTMIITILICTIDEGILKVPHVLMPQQEGVCYVVSMQWTKEDSLALVPNCLKEREDVSITYLRGAGLSRNRNNALACAKGDVMVIADDDNRYKPEFFDNIRSAYEEHPDADVITFQAQDLDGHPLHKYPAPYVTSMEMTFRSHVKTRFNERFGLGSGVFCAGEEQVWMKDAQDEGWNVMYVPVPIVMTRRDTTGTHFLERPQLQICKGAVFRYVYGTADAVWRSLKEAGWYLVHKGENPFPILLNMIKGIRSL